MGYSPRRSQPEEGPPIQLDIDRARDGGDHTARDLFAKCLFHPEANESGRDEAAAAGRLAGARQARWSLRYDERWAHAGLHSGGVGRTRSNA